MSETGGQREAAQLRRSPVVAGAAAEAHVAEDFDAEFPSLGLYESVRDQVLGESVDAPPPPAPSARAPRADRLLHEAQEIFRRAREREEAARAAEEGAGERTAQIEREAYEVGYREGERAGLEMGQAKMEPLLQDFNKLIERIAAVHDEVIRANQEQLLDLAVAIATRLLHRDLETSPDQIMQTLEEVLTLIGREQRVRLRVSQADFQHLIDHQDQIPALSRLGDNVTFEVDPDMLRGGCLAKTDTGVIDATIETMYQDMRHALTEKHGVIGDSADAGA